MSAQPAMLAGDLMAAAEHSPARLSNADIANHLDATADLLEAQHANPYRIRAYRTAAEMLQSLRLPVSDIFEREGVEGLRRLPTIGVSLASAIEQLLDTGTTATKAGSSGWGRTRPSGGVALGEHSCAPACNCCATREPMSRCLGQQAGMSRDSSCLRRRGLGCCARFAGLFGKRRTRPAKDNHSADHDSRIA